MAWINRKEYPNGTSQLSGRLYNKYYNSRRRSKTGNPAEGSAIPEAGSSLAIEPGTTPDTSWMSPKAERNISPGFLWFSAEIVAADDETSGCILWLECSTKPWETVKKFWQKTSKCRMSQLRQGTDVFEYLARFLAFKQPTAHELVSWKLSRKIPLIQSVCVKVLSFKFVEYRWIAIPLVDDLFCFPDWYWFHWSMARQSEGLIHGVAHLIAVFHQKDRRPGQRIPPRWELQPK